MKICLVGPRHEGGSIPPYLNTLYTLLPTLGCAVTWVGSNGLPYDPYRSRFWSSTAISQAADDLAERVQETAAGADVISLHYGNLEIEQLLHTRFNRSELPPVVTHVHTLDPTLFATHAPNAELAAESQRGLASADAFVCFGSYAHTLMRARHPAIPATVAFLPTTIAAGTQPEPWILPGPAHHPTASLYGYAADWKDLPLLVEACEHVAAGLKIVIAGPFWNEHLPAGHHRLGQVDLYLSTEYLSPKRRLALIQATDFAVFPYRSHPSFQGSGAIADYLHNGVPVLATTIANFSEVIATAGITVPPSDPERLAAALTHLATDTSQREALRVAAQQRGAMFSATAHAQQCLNWYQAIHRCYLDT